MHKAPALQSPLPASYVGIDVSKDHLDLCCFDTDGRRRTRRFRNAASGHQRLVHWLARPARVVVESTGRYGLDLTLALHTAEHVEVMVANPKALRGYAKAQMRRTKTDRAWCRGHRRLCAPHALLALAAA